MASTQQLAEGFISDADLLESEAQTAFEQMVSLIKELCGGTGDNAMLQLSSDAFGVQPNVSTYLVDSEGATGNDDLKWVSGTARDGQLIAIRPYNTGRAITIYNGAGGAGQILTKNGQNFSLTKLGQFAILKYVAGSPGYWEEWLRDETARIDQLLGARAASSVSVTASQITVDRGRHTVTSGTTTNIDQALGVDTFDHDGNLLILSQGDNTYTRTLRHNQGTTGKFNLLGGANIVMVSDAFYCFSKNGTTWDHLFTIFKSAPIAPSTAAGKIPIGDGAGGWSESGGTLAKGSLPVGTSGSAIGYLAVGADGTIPYADSTQTTGIKWDNPTSGGGIYGDGADGAKTISTNTTETVPKIFRLTTLTIQTGCTWTVKSGTLILCTGAVDIQGTGQLVVSADIPGGTGETAAYYPSNLGLGPSPGLRTASSYQNSISGAGCGGAGGNGGYTAGFNAAKGGQARLPCVGLTGSGGAGGTTGGQSGVCGDGGPGGGALGLYSGSTITIAASAKITANGGNGTSQTGGYGGAGSGGSGGAIDIGALTSIINNGTIEAKGGLGGNGVNNGFCAAGGGGGIVNLTAPSITAGTITLTGGAPGTGGTAYTTAPQAGSSGATYSTTAIPVKYRIF